MSLQVRGRALGWPSRHSMAAAGATGQNTRSRLVATIPEQWFEYPSLEGPIEGECAMHGAEPKRSCFDWTTLRQRKERQNRVGRGRSRVGRWVRRVLPCGPVWSRFDQGARGHWGARGRRRRIAARRLATKK